MDLTETRQGDVTILALTGNVDTRSAYELEQKVRQLLEGGVRRFVVDFQQVDLVTSSGLRVLLMLAKKLEAGGGLALCSLSDHVKAVFEISGLARYFVMVPSRQEAIDRIPAAPKVSKVTGLVGQILGSGGSAKPLPARGQRRSPITNAVAQLLSRSDVHRVAAQVGARAKPGQPTKKSS